MLAPSDFAAFVSEVHGHEAFPWQQALVDRVASSGVWPTTIDIPTGLGKTSVLDVAVFLAALDPGLSRRRVFFVVDRRLVVDEAYDHARKIQRVLDKPQPGSVAEEVGRRLRIDGSDTVLEIARMRGGVTWDSRWLQRPDQYAIVTGTVDQVGSRLLFRGYGVTEQARSIDAALVGTDSLIIVDEAHLAAPLVETIHRLAELDQGDLAPRPTIITMTATPTTRSTQAHTIDDRDADHPVARARLHAAKRLHLIEVTASRASAPVAVAGALARLGTALARSGATVGVVVNTVARARAVFDRVRQEGIETVLLIGRSRPVDREYLLRAYYDRLRVGRARIDRPLVLVATQTVEVGANIDLDALVTECAPLDALVQRLGRLNRLGEIGEPGAQALVVYARALGDDDRVYGRASASTWQWLVQQGSPLRYTPRLDPTSLSDGILVSPVALRDLTSRAPEGLVSEPAYVPLLTEQTLDAWARTSPTPHPDPPVAPYLHGLTDSRPGVRVVWRADLSKDTTSGWKEAVSALPPTADEEIEVSRSAVVRWLEVGGSDPVMGDVEATAEVDEGQPELPPKVRPQRVWDEQGRPLVLRVRSREDIEPVPASRIAPGDLIVVPVTYGGCDRYGWNPTSTEDVVDVSDLAGRRGRPVLRLGPYLRTVIDAYHPELAESPALVQLLDQVAADAIEGELLASDYRTLLGRLIEPISDGLASGGAPPFVRNVWLLQEAAVVSPAEQPWHAVLARRGVSFAEDRSATGSSAVGRRITLRSHQEHVSEMARTIAERLGLPPHVVESVALAGRWHDEGKRDPRFQAMLWGGDHRSAEIAPEPIAKSGMNPADRRAHERARRRAGYPRGLRHESLSAQIAEVQAASYEGIDADLVTHLVASHHGYGRPLLPAVVDRSPAKVAVGGRVFSTEATVDWEAPARFARLNQRYGRWGLALLEAVVRLADMWCSAHDLGGEIQ